MNQLLLPQDSQMLLETVPALLPAASGWKDTEIDFSMLGHDAFAAAFAPAHPGLAGAATAS